MMRRIVSGALGLGLLMTLAACPNENATSNHETKNRAAQQSAMEVATTSVAVPKTKHFLARQNLAEYMKRMDTPEKLFYVYERGENGNTVGYYVSRTYPQSVCTFMTPPEQVVHKDWGMDAGASVVVSAPALDGVYYKGGGCDTYFFFDAATDAMILTSMKFTVADQPLSLEADPVTVQIQNAPVQ